MTSHPEMLTVSRLQGSSDGEMRVFATESLQKMESDEECTIMHKKEEDRV